MAGLSRTGVVLSLGMMSTPVRVESGLIPEDKTTTFVTMCVGGTGEHPEVHPPQQVRCPTVCPTCDVITDKTLLERGIPTDAGYAVVGQEAIAEVKKNTDGRFKRVIDLLPSPAADVLDTTAQGEKLYQLIPEGDPDRYAMIAAVVVSRPDLAFMAMYTITSKVTQYRLRSRNGVLLLEERVNNAARLRPLPQIDTEIKKPVLLEMVEAMVDQLITPFDADTYAGDYASAIDALAAAAELTVTLVHERAATPVARTDDEIMAALVAMLTRDVA